MKNTVNFELSDKMSSANKDRKGQSKPGQVADLGAGLSGFVLFYPSLHMYMYQ